MKHFIFVIIILTILLCLNNSHINEPFYQIPKRNLLGPSVNGNLTTNTNYYNSNNYAIDPKKYFLSNGYLIGIPYDDLIYNNFNGNIKRSLALSAIREILSDTKIILNGNRQDISFDYINVKELKPNYDDYKTIMNLILNSINTVAKKQYLIKPTKTNLFKLYQDKNKFMINVEINCDVTNYDDDIIEQKIPQILSKNQKDTLTEKNPLKINLIIHFLINNFDDMNIYISNLSAITTDI